MNPPPHLEFRVDSPTARPDDDHSCTLTQPKHAEEDLTAFESSNRISKFFGSISQEYSPLNVKILPEYVQHKLTNGPSYLTM